jgi:hypothetical protein
MKTIEEKLAANQLDRLAKHWSGMKGKRIQPTDAIKLSTMVAKFGKDELEQLAAKDIPFLSMAAINNLMIKHNYNAAKIKSLMKEDTELLYDLYMFEDVDAGEYDYEGDMAKTQLVTISDAAEELHDMLEDDENMPEWCQNKITKAMDYLDSVRDYMLAKDTGEEPGNENPNESVKLDEVATPAMKKAGNELNAYAKKSGGIDKADFMKAADMLTSGKAGMPFIKFVNGQDTEVFEKIITVMSKHMGRQTVEKMFKVRVREERLLEKMGKSSSGYDLYHKDFSSAMKHAYDHAKKKLGIEIDPDEIDDKVAMGPKKPSNGKTNSYRLMGTDKKGKSRGVQIQVANLDNKKYELNMYKEEVQIDEASKEGTIRIIDLGRMGKGKGFQVQRMTKGKFVDQGKPYKSQKDAEKVRKDGQHSMQFEAAPKIKGDWLKKERERNREHDAAMGRTATGRKKPIRTMTSTQKSLASFREQMAEGAMKRIATTQSNKADRMASSGKKGLETFRKKPQNEKLEVSDGMGAWIDDFKQSDAPQFKGKNAKERRDMAIAAYLDAKKDSE